MKTALELYLRGVDLERSIFYQNGAARPDLRLAIYALLQCFLLRNLLSPHQNVSHVVEERGRYLLLVTGSP
jgi:hypothetical protein